MKWIFVWGLLALLLEVVNAKRIDGLNLGVKLSISPVNNNSKQSKEAIMKILDFSDSLISKDSKNAMKSRDAQNSKGNNGNSYDLPLNESQEIGVDMHDFPTNIPLQESKEAGMDIDDLPMELTAANMSKLYWGFGGLFGNSHKEPQQLSLPQNEDSPFSMNDVYGSFDRHPCRRVCQQGQSRTCYYRLIVHNYQTLGPECQQCSYDPAACEKENCVYGDGVPNIIMAVNRQWPAPAIEVCENDTVVADVLNYLTEDTTMHWHGMHMSQTPEMDGVPFVTQYPLSPGEVQRYQFPIDRSGTLFYHSHMDWQRARGIAGAFVIRQSKEYNRHARLYDYDLIDHTIVLHDIGYNADLKRPRNILINGQGRNQLNSWPDNDSRHRLYAQLSVSSNMRYRMRVIYNGVSNCPLEFSIENHKMLMIATDGNDLEPIYADKFFLTSAERFDFIVQANQYAGNYWIRVKGYHDCAEQNLYQGAILHYRGSSRKQLPVTDILDTSNLKILNQAKQEPLTTVNTVAELISKDATWANIRSNDVPTLGLTSLYPLPWPSYTKFITYYTSFGDLIYRGEEYLQVDDITYASPRVSLLQGRHLFNDDNYFCNRTAFQAAGINCRRVNCECTNVLRIPAYKPIELVVTNLMNTTHPFHPHGFTFRLVAQDILGNANDLRNIEELDRRGRLKRTADNFPAVEKDTIQIPPLGYIILRFISSNPGFWMYHCHIERHVLLGMSAVMKVGENNQMKKITPAIKC